ncbi:MAG TPA: site-specific DNA-methyltransferase [Candidatus Cybelea sp.]|nr:site-specific DNA-methyltransferase [Candidatus Cybelea sp.]
MSDIRLLVGDAAESMAALPPRSVDLVLADPPYNLGKDYGNNRDVRAWADYESFTRAWLTEAVRVLKPTGSLYVFMGVRFIGRLQLMLEEDFGLLFNGWISWHYTQGMGRKRGFSPRHEDILYFTRGADFTFNLDDVRVPQKYYRRRNNMAGANPGDVWQFSHVHYCSGERRPHPTQKPEALIERILRASSNADDLVLDPFLGSGTTARVAQALGRRCVGIDVNPDYIAMAKARLAEPFGGFDSADPRRVRRPLDAPNDGELPL